jgi:uncharacterized protein YbcC (UPF0753/DUF2309 family)
MARKTHADRSLRDTLDHIAHLLPVQGPIGVFVHHNTLHSFQHKPFEEAVVEAASIYGAQPYLPEESYRDEMRRGRILLEDIDAVLAMEPNAPVIGQSLDRRTLRRMILLSGHQVSDPDTLRWRLEEDRSLRGDALSLFELCLQRLPSSSDEELIQPERPRDSILHHLGVDLDEVIHPPLIRLASSYLDQGLAYWPMPSRERGFYISASQLLAQPGALHGEHLGGVVKEFRRQISAGYQAEDSVRDALAFLGIEETRCEAFLQTELLALPGWSGMFRTLEQSPHLAPHVTVPASLMDFLAVRLSLLRVALQSVTHGAADCWRMPIQKETNRRLHDAALVFDAARAIFLSPAELQRMPDRGFAALVHEATSFTDLERRRIWHLAYERRHELQILVPLRTHRRSLGEIAKRSRPLAQVFFCLDEREESLRRHLEEHAPDIETFGAAGFFGVAIDYKSIEDAKSKALCPVVQSPKHAVREKVARGHESAWDRWISFRRLSGRLSRSGFIASRSLVRGWLATWLLGVLSLFPMIARVLTPRQYMRLRERLNDIIIPKPETELAFTNENNELVDGLQRGFSVIEKAERVATVLGGAGLIRNFSRLVIVLGHGSTSVNNPFESAYNCGACGGHRGGPNARLFAAMANLPSVRRQLVSHGIFIPEDTYFLGGYHDTSNDEIEIYDADRLPESHQAEFEAVQRALDEARAWNAHERSRRFMLADSRGEARQALRHVEERAEHIAEPRPEYGHCTNAVCIVGRRAITSGLFLDRRAFLVSYDSFTDPDDRYLAQQLSAAVPVCAGINLEYYFSSVDNEVYGCGTKLPHNVTGLIGVMNGHLGDLRTGLPLQTVEIHEPVRVLFVIETTPARLNRVIQACPPVREFFLNRWVRVSTIDPHSGVVHVLRDGQFELLPEGVAELPVASSSTDWYRGRSGHLPIARIAPQGPASTSTLGVQN